MGDLQHNKTIVVDGDKVKAVVCGSTNFSWRGFYVQSNNAVVLRGEGPAKDFMAAFDSYWEHSDLGGSTRLPPPASPTSGKKVTADDAIFVYGISGRKVTSLEAHKSDGKAGGIELQKPDGNVSPVYPAELDSKVPPPFKAEPSGGSGVRLHHKFVVIDFDKPTARVYFGSYNFSNPKPARNRGGTRTGRTPKRCATARSSPEEKGPKRGSRARAGGALRALPGERGDRTRG